MTNWIMQRLQARFWLPHLVMMCFALASGCSAPPAPPPALSPAPAAAAERVTPTGARATCTPTHDDGVSPTYKPGAPLRQSVGHGHILRGTVRSSRDCAPIAGATVEVWPEYEGRGHPDEYRASVVTGADGRYSFECPLPEHIHMRIAADGYLPIGNNSHHPNGRAEGTLDIVLQPADAR